ncbi:Thioredoxin H-type [Zostera marina]|uniref:Thioredoxin H-type n=1 Tax=Zostera marina TaxID=29655 RepID=A0A0K9P4F6_ZOSMR|nr:Thioredoxin H-type [Zostera marina]
MGNCVAVQKADNDDQDDAMIDLSNRNVHIITTKEIWDQKISEAMQDGKMVVANFTASWCAPCRLIAPFFGGLSDKFTSLMFLMVDVDELADFSSSWDIQATPTFYFLRDGEKIDKLVGANRHELEKKIVKFSGLIF